MRLAHPPPRPHPTRGVGAPPYPLRSSDSRHIMSRGATPRRFRHPCTASCKPPPLPVSPSIPLARRLSEQGVPGVGRAGVACRCWRRCVVSRVAFPCVAWWSPGRGFGGGAAARWAAVGVALPVRVPVLAVGRASGPGFRSGAVVLPASVAFGGDGSGLCVVPGPCVAPCPGAHVAWGPAWGAAGGAPWAAVRARVGRFLPRCVARWSVAA